MHFDCKQHLDGRWGIYRNLELLATMECQWQCQTVVAQLQQRLAAVDENLVSAVEVEPEAEEPSLVA